ncbi:MAG TPA: DUF1254 domain-containing protein [Candidatus Udaeobacter sp.]|nr:DUF1254 domain-containing protein [Candidatus Udaeobacter sp.]
MTRWMVAVALIAVITGCNTNRGGVAKQPAATPEEARAIAKEATIYGFPLVDNYRILHAYFVDTANPEYKGPWNVIANTARVYTPADKAVQTPNSDTPYSMLGADLRTEPLVLSFPAIDKSRYYSAQFIDLYTHNFRYVGSRATGNDGGDYLLTGPHWKGEAPPGITGLIQSETDLVLVIYRTQLFSPDDLENVVKVQSGYLAQPLSGFLKQNPPAPAPAIQFMTPLTVAEERSSPRFFEILNFALQFCPTHPSEEELMARFGRLGIGAKGAFNAQELSPQMQQAVAAGMADAWQAFEEFKVQEVETNRVSSGDLLGTRESLKNNYLYRMAGAVLGIYGNSKEEAMYPSYLVDSDGQTLDGATNRYTLRFASNQLPPVNAFWSITMYELPASLLSENPLHRYLINSTMLPDLVTDSGGITLYLQHESPGRDKEANWLPAPSGPFFVAMRLYWPKPDALEGRWTKPPLERVKPES